MRGRGDKGTHNPLPPGCNHHRNAHHARFNNTKHIFLRVQSWPRASSHAPPYVRQPSPAHVSMQRDIRVFIWSPLQSTLLTTRMKKNVLVKGFHIVCTVCMYVRLSGIQHWWSIKTSNRCMYVFTLKGHCIKRRHHHDKNSSRYHMSTYTLP